MSRALARYYRGRYLVHLSCKCVGRTKSGILTDNSICFAQTIAVAVAVAAVLDCHRRWSQQQKEELRGSSFTEQDLEQLKMVEICRALLEKSEGRNILLGVFY